MIGYSAGSFLAFWGLGLLGGVVGLTGWVFRGLGYGPYGGFLGFRGSWVWGFRALGFGVLVSVLSF